MYYLGRLQGVEEVEVMGAMLKWSYLPAIVTAI